MESTNRHEKMIVGKEILINNIIAILRNDELMFEPLK